MKDPKIFAVCAMPMSGSTPGVFIVDINKVSELWQEIILAEYHCDDHVPIPPEYEGLEQGTVKLPAKVDATVVCYWQD
jgi:hypothetical protein